MLSVYLSSPVLYQCTCDPPQALGHCAFSRQSNTGCGDVQLVFH